MVSSVHSRLLARKASNIENAAPPARSDSLKRTHTSVSNAVSDIARRRRPARPSGVRTPRYMVEQAKRRNQTRPPPVKLDIVITSPEDDIQMADATSKPASTRIRVELPRTLGRPDFKEVSGQVLGSIEPDLAQTPADYIRDALEEIGPRYVFHLQLLVLTTGPNSFGSMMKVLSSVVASTAANTLPTQIDVTVGDLSHDVPTHMLAVYTPVKDTESKLPVKLYPVHGVILAAHCANISALPESHPSIPEPGSSIKLPVVPFNLPHADSWPLLSAFLYTRRIEALMASLMPCPPPVTVDDESGRVLLQRYARALAATLPSRTIHKRLQIVYGLWANACRLGVFEHGLWTVIDRCWEVLLTALTISVGRPDLMLSPSA